MSEGTSIPVVVSTLLDLIVARVGSSARVLDQTPTQVVDMLANSGHPVVIYLYPTIEVGYSVVTATGGELWIDEEFVLPVVCEVSAEAASITLDDARHLCGRLVYDVLAVVARKPNLDIADDPEHQYFDSIPSTGAYLHGAIGDNAVAVGVRHVVNVKCHSRLKLLLS